MYQLHTQLFEYFGGDFIKNYGDRVDQELPPIRLKTIKKLRRMQIFPCYTQLADMIFQS